MGRKQDIEEDIIKAIKDGVTTKIELAEKMIHSRNLESFEAYEIIDDMVNTGQLKKEKETVGDYHVRID
ncbi:hypothetical protein [Alkalicoccobacillus murimartini]|uniref:Uncharacterized protein n=1 Tax=Alkalicoccobacillus murimartini TaxID=171685 RepID=A0ABT9YFG4_9BACI|nr:hypothetical protein [Alkalicoccobacillus murimartini]MDQ0206555.1 hypothetical protein [Alkalicoccobacillus murimartini]